MSVTSTGFFNKKWGSHPELIAMDKGNPENINFSRIPFSSTQPKITPSLLPSFSTEGAKFSMRLRGLRHSPREEGLKHVTNIQKKVNFF
jgi:hypothetical protein